MRAVSVIYCALVVELGSSVERKPMKLPESDLKQLDIPSDMAWLFPEYAFPVMDVQTHQGVIIERVLERGSWEQLRWLFATYGEAAVADWIAKHGFRLLSRRSFALWRLVLNVEQYHAPDWAIAAKQLPESW